jgi:protein-S-isoprenylcysteine O-methyltransferase Ste14
VSALNYLPSFFVVIAVASLFFVVPSLVRDPAARERLRRTAAPRVVAFAGFVLIAISAWIPAGPIQRITTDVGLGLLIVAAVLALRYWWLQRKARLSA